MLCELTFVELVLMNQTYYCWQDTSPRKNSTDAGEVRKSCVHQVQNTNILTNARAGGLSKTISIITGDAPYS